MRWLRELDERWLAASWPDKVLGRCWELLWLWVRVAVATSAVAATAHAWRLM